MLRAIQNGERVATAVHLKDGKILQVFPSKETFESEESWKECYPDAEIKQEGKHIKKCRDHFKHYVSEAMPKETPMQKLVRQLYIQYVLPDSMIQKQIPAFTINKPSRLYCFYASEGRMVPVYFNRTSGHVVFNGKIQDDTLTVGLSFFLQKTNRELIIVKPLEQEKKPGQKTLLYKPQMYHIDSQERTIQRLMEEGFYIRFYGYPYRIPTLDFIKYVHEEHSIDYIITDVYRDFVYYIDTTIRHESIYKTQKHVDFETWINERKPKVVITGIFGNDFKAPESIDVSGNKLELVDVGHLIGIDDKQKAFYKREKSGIIQPLEVAEATLKYIQKHVVPCSIETCMNQVLSKTGKPCWMHEN